MGADEDDVVSSRPAILYGALRSGSTLVHLMLGGHPMLLCTGECDFLFDHVVWDGRGYRLDRAKLSKSRMFDAARIPLPQSDDAKTAICEMVASLQTRGSGRLVIVLHRHLDLAYKLLGALDTLHLVRDPRDVARSSVLNQTKSTLGRRKRRRTLQEAQVPQSWRVGIFCQMANTSVEIGFSGIYEFGADHWRETELQWRRSVSIPGIRKHGFKYEDLVSDPVGQLTLICDFLGVPFDDGLFDYTRTTTYGYPDASLREQWKTKVAPASVARLEARIGEDLLDAGYSQSSSEVLPANAVAWTALRITNRAMIWRRMILTYGVFAPVLRGIGRRVGLMGLEHFAQRRIDEVDLKRLK